MRWLRDLLRSFAHEGRAVLVSSHALGEVAQCADDIVIVRQGRSVLQAPLVDVLAQHAGSGLEDIYLELTADPTGGAR
jgi:ABC-2 type transport system ATP-binding protein